MQLSLEASAPDILQHAISLCQPVQGIVALAHGSYKSGQGVDLALACESAVFINLANGDLDGCVILGLDNAVGCAALAGDVTVKTLRISFNSLFEGWFDAAHLALWRDIQVDELSLIVFHICGFFALNAKVTGRLRVCEDVD